MALLRSIKVKPRPEGRGVIAGSLERRESGGRRTGPEEEKSGMNQRFGNHGWDLF